MLNFGKWYYKDEFTPTGEMFDVGNTCSYAIDNYFAHKKSCMECGLTDERSNGNGSLMRIHPAALYIADMNISIEDKVAVIEMVSALTHAHNRSKMGCGIYSFVLWELLDKPNKASIISGLRKARTYYFKTVKSPEYQHYHELLFRRTACLFRHFEDYDTFRPATKDEIKSSGYVVDSLTAAIWCLLNTSTYEDCVLEAVNLGDDTDTIAAIAGGLAGALYGYEAIPQNWKDTLLRCDYIEDMCERAWNKWKE